MVAMYPFSFPEQKHVGVPQRSILYTLDFASDRQTVLTYLNSSNNPDVRETLQKPSRVDDYGLSGIKGTTFWSRDEGQYNSHRSQIKFN